jgi:hypothetical protein
MTENRRMKQGSMKQSSTPADGAVHVALSFRCLSQNPSIQSRRRAYTPCTLATCFSQPLPPRERQRGQENDPELMHAPWCPMT